MKYQTQYVKIEELSIKMLSQGSIYQTPSNDELSNFNLNLVCKARCDAMRSGGANIGRLSLSKAHCAFEIVIN